MKNRPIKFRAYDTKEKKWLFDYPTLGGFSMFGELHIMDELHIEQLEHIAVMQSTGVVDNNNNLIYEGDVVKTADEYGEVQYDVQQSSFIILFQPHNKKRKSGCANLSSTFPSPAKEIIGNVFDNPSLLT